MLLGLFFVVGGIAALMRKGIQLLRLELQPGAKTPVSAISRFYSVAVRQDCLMGESGRGGYILRMAPATAGWLGLVLSGRESA